MSDSVWSHEKVPLTIINSSHEEMGKQVMQYKSSVSCSTLIWVYLFATAICGLLLHIRGVICN